MLTAPAVRWLPAYATHLPFCNNRVDAFTDKSGQKCIFGLPYSSEALSHLYLINTETGESRKYRLPGDEHGAYCDVLGSDNRIYLGTLKGRLLAFDPVSTKFEELCFPFEGQYIWGGLATKAGKVFAGATPSGSFIVWDIASRKIEYTETRKFSGSVYANCFVELPDGRVLVGVGGAETHIGIYDPLKKTTSWHRPSWLEGITFVYGQRCFNGQIVLRTFPTKELLFIRPDDLSLIRRMEAQGDVCALPDGAGAERLYTSDGLSGKLYVLNGDRFEHVATPVPYEGGSLCALGPTTLATITNDATFFRYDVKTGHTFAKQLNSAESGGMACSALASDGKDRLFVTPFINQRLVEMDLRDGSSREVGRVAEHTGQVPVMGWHKGRLFLAYYTYAGICVYDPQKPYKFRENPKVLGLVGDEQYRPTGRMQTDGRRLYFTTRAMYGTLGGAIVAIDPETNTYKSFRNVIPDQNLSGVVFEPVTGLLFAASEIAGDCGSCLPKAKAAEWVAWDPRTEKRVAGGVLEGCEAAQILISIGDGRLLLHSEYTKHLKVLDARTMTLVESAVPLPAEDCRPIAVAIRASNGQIYGVGGGHLFRWDPGSGETEKLLDFQGKCLIEASPGRLVFNDKARIGEHWFA